MSIQWSLKDLDFTKAIEVIPSQDPQTSLRFNLPVPNWLDDTGRPETGHSQIKQDENGSWRFYFQNFKDNCLQHVKIDGSSVITFMGTNPEKSKELIRLAGEYAPDIEHMTPEQLSHILERSHSELRLEDRYNNSRKGVESRMHPYDEVTTNHSSFGAFLPKPSVSTVVYIQGAGVFLDGPTATPQRFENGAFISIPGKNKKQVLKMSKEELLGGKDFTAKLIQADVFTSSRTLADGGAINVSALPRQEAPASNTAPATRRSDFKGFTGS